LTIVGFAGSTWSIACSTAFAELVRRDADDAAGRAPPTQLLRHREFGRVEVVLVADEQEVGLAREQVDHVRDDRFAVDLDQRFRHAVTGAAETLTETGHGDDDLHAELPGDVRIQTAAERESRARRYASASQPIKAATSSTPR
jgi:hypothetical protein